MSASDHLGKQWTKVYRGVDKHPDKVDLTKTGTHWTPSLEAAKSFAGYEPNATILEGHVHSSEVVKPHTEEWYRVGGILPGSEEEQLAEAGQGHHLIHSILDPKKSWEKEITIRKGGLVHVGTVHHFKSGILTSRENINATGQA